MAIPDLANVQLFEQKHLSNIEQIDEIAHSSYIQLIYYVKINARDPRLTAKSHFVTSKVHMKFDYQIPLSSSMNNVQSAYRTHYHIFLYDFIRKFIWSRSNRISRTQFVFKTQDPKNLSSCVLCMFKYTIFDIQPWHIMAFPYQIGVQIKCVSITCALASPHTL